MDSARDRLWTTEACLAWGDQWEGKHAFDRQRVTPTTVGSLACQRVIGNPWKALWQLPAGVAYVAIRAMRRQTGSRVQYPGVEITLPGLGGTLPMQIVYQGLMFAA